MGNLHKIALILALLTLSVGKVNAAVLSSDFIKSEIKKDLQEYVSTIVPGKVDVEVGEIPYKSINIQSSDVIINATSNLKYFTPLTVAKVEILSDGQIVKSFGVPVKLNVYDLVWVAKDTINRGESINETNIALEKKSINQLAGNAAGVDFSPNNNLVRKTFRPGDIIDTRYIESAPVVMKNSPVSVIFKTNYITISLSGESLDDGKVGDYVRVRNKKYKKDYTGKVVSANTILVKL